MEELYNIGICEITIKDMVEVYPELRDITKNEIKEKENILKIIKCDDIQIINIISSNPFFLGRTNSEIIKLINYLHDFGFGTLNVLFDSNPYILNLEVFEIDEYITKRKNNGEKESEIIDDLASNPYLFSGV